MTSTELLAAAELESVKRYHQRQNLEAARLNIAQQINQCEKEMLILDGRIDVLKELIAALQPQEP